MFLNPAKPEHLILLRHLDEILQSLLVFFGAVTCPVDEGDADSLV